MRYIVDIDGTICEHLDNPNFGRGEIFYQRIEKLNQLYDKGHEIVYYTARGMGEFSGDVQKANDKWYDYTVSQLESWGCKYTDILVGKQSGDVYIDDKAVNSEDFFQNK